MLNPTEPAVTVVATAASDSSAELIVGNEGGRDEVDAAAAIEEGQPRRSKPKKSKRDGGNDSAVKPRPSLMDRIRNLLTRQNMNDASSLLTAIVIVSGLIHFKWTGGDIPEGLLPNNDMVRKLRGLINCTALLMESSKGGGVIP